MKRAHISFSYLKKMGSHVALAYIFEKKMQEIFTKGYTPASYTINIPHSPGVSGKTQQDSQEKGQKRTHLYLLTFLMEREVCTSPKTCTS